MSGQSNCMQLQARQLDTISSLTIR